MFASLFRGGLDAIRGQSFTSFGRAILREIAKPGSGVATTRVHDLDVSQLEDAPGVEIRVRNACRKAGVRRLAYTSIMDVVYGASPVVDADETLPFPKRFTNDYA